MSLAEELFNIKPIKNESTSRVAKCFLTYVLILFLVRLILFVISWIISCFHNIQFAEAIIKVPIGILVLNNVLIIPVIEELIYRLPLKFSSKNLQTAVSVALIFQVIYLHLDVYFKEDSMFIMLIVMMLVVIIYIIRFFLTRRRTVRRLGILWKNHYNVIFVMLLVLFSLAHMGNFKIDSYKDFIVVSVILTGIFVQGFLYAHARLKLGLLASIVLHSINNSIYYVIAFIF